MQLVHNGRRRFAGTTSPFDDNGGFLMLQRETDCRALARRVTMGPFALIAVLLFLASVSQPARSQTYSVIYNFTGKASDGATPYGGPILDQSGNLYGTTYLGGSFGAGSV